MPTTAWATQGAISPVGGASLPLDEPGPGPLIMGGSGEADQADVIEGAGALVVDGDSFDVL